MARNAEKSNLLLNKWVSMKEAHAKGERRGGAREERRPYLASECKSLPDAERWRRMVIGEISRKISEIQNAGLGEARLRDLNDEINKSIREKGHWERQIRALGGADHGAVSARLFEGEGRELPGSRGYRYFGAAKDLPGVRELFEGAAAAAASSGGGAGAGGWRGRADLARHLTPDYYGWRDEEDGTLVEREGRREAEWRAQGVAEWEAARAERGDAAAGSAGAGQDEGMEHAAGGAPAGLGALRAAPRPISAAEIEAAGEKRRRELLQEKYGKL
jgi:pre-mRNA-splicing factor ISY1